MAAPGSVFARGYEEGLRAYALVFLDREFKIEYLLDVNPFNGKKLPQSVAKRHEYKLGGLDGGANWAELFSGNSVPDVGAPPGGTDISTKQDKLKGHRIKDMSERRIPTIGHGGKERKIEHGSNNEK